MTRARECVLIFGLLGACSSEDDHLGQSTAAIEATTAVTWVGRVNTTVNGTTIMKTGGQPSAEDAGAASQESVAAGDAAFQFTVDETSRFRFVGFGHTSTWQGASNMDYSFRMQSGHADVYEHNTWKANILIGVGDVMKIDVVGVVAHYYKNGALQLTSSQAPVYPLYVITSMIDGSSTIAQAKISSTAPPTGAVVWGGLVNTTVNGTTITKTGGQTWAEDAGAASQQSVGSGAATFQYTVDETSRFRFVGFGHTSSWQGAANIDFSFRMQSGHADVYQNANYVTDILVAGGDTLEIRVASGVAGYYKNGALQYTSTHAPIYPLYVITSMIDTGSTIAQATITGGTGGGGGTGTYGTVGTYGHASSPYAWPNGTWHAYAQSSPFNTPLPTNPTLRSNSTAIVDRMLHFTSDSSPQPNLAAGTQAANMTAPPDGTGGWPTYYGTASDPIYFIACNEFGGQCTPAVNHMAVHAPAGAVIQGGNGASSDSDRHLTIVDQTTGNVFDLWHVSTTPLPSGGTTIQTGWSGYSIITGDGRAQQTGEGNAGRFGNLVGRIRVEELQAGLIDHALTIVVNCTNNASVYPASTNHGLPCADPTNAPPMGARFRLNLTPAQIDALPISAWKNTVLKAMSKYGAFMNDTGSSFYFDWQLESGNQYTTMGAADPWWAFGAANWGTWNGEYVGAWHNNDDGIDWLNQVWSRLQVVDECVSLGSC